MAVKRDKPELLAPAGDMERLKMAVLYGADAVYLAGTSFGMRAFAGNFSDEELPQAVAFAHSHGVRVHCTINTMPRNDEAARLPEHLERLADAGVDALIVADLGAFTMAGKYAPRCERHISTQASICNYETARAWHDLGASRVILARELSLEEIRTIRDKTPADLEIEAFVHGAMCVSYSGRCLLSNYMTGRDSSRGACAQPCRYQYALVEEKRPGEYFPVFEDEQGTYILNSRDMCMIDHLGDLCGAGLSSLKIEGRAKSAYYAAIVTGAYRHCLDAAAAGGVRRSRVAGRGGTREPPALLHRLLLRPAGPVLRHFPLCPGMAGGGGGDGLRQRRARRAVPAEQVPRRGHGGDRGPGSAALLHNRAGDAGRGGGAPGGTPHPTDEILYGPSQGGAAVFPGAPRGGPVSQMRKNEERRL